MYKVYNGLDQAESAFVEMRDGKQFGKIVVVVDPKAQKVSSGTSYSLAKL